MFLSRCTIFCFFFFNDTATTEIYTLSLHDALPICPRPPGVGRSLAPAPGIGRLRRLTAPATGGHAARGIRGGAALRDRKSTRLNSSHGYISYAVFCLKKKITLELSACTLQLAHCDP